MYHTAIHFFLASVAVTGAYASKYSLLDDYTPEKWLDGFEISSAKDPSGGYVKYVDVNTAKQNGLFSTGNGTVHAGVDSKNEVSGARESIRMHSKKQYSTGLFLADITHMPGSACGIWPAYWMTGPDWPNNGEIDIIEGVNLQSADQMAIHTGAGCRIKEDPGRGMSGSKITSTDCNVKAKGQSQNQGCTIMSQNKNTFGDGFNQGNGGVVATEITSKVVSNWFFPRSQIPSDIQSGKPDPSSWSNAASRFECDGCDFSKFIKQQQIVFNIDFCGGWAEGEWSENGCSKKGGSCKEYVQKNPKAFTDVYWEIKSLKVYQDGGSGGNSGSSPSGSSSQGSSPNGGGSPSQGASPSQGNSPSQGASPSGSPNEGSSPSQGASPNGSPSEGGSPSQGASPSQGNSPSQGASPSGSPNEGSSPSQGASPNGSPSEGGSPNQGAPPKPSFPPMQGGPPKPGGIKSVAQAPPAVRDAGFSPEKAQQTTGPSSFLPDSDARLTARSGRTNSFEDTKTHRRRHYRERIHASVANLH